MLIKNGRPLSGFAPTDFYLIIKTEVFDVEAIILFILGVSVLAAGFLSLKRELSTESVSISSTDEAKSELKKILDDHGWFYLTGIALFMQFIFRGFHFTFEHFFMPSSLALELLI
ncbi:hypothetical protein P9D36_05910 [Bacillus haynesii]|uniref:hypothetical protein n=1 Tax=Bacillus haynesii TaxID=1925021 RepID=UPI002DBC7BA8|nr:hypothetical protein [Bacillus haynesii]MEC1446900.1 hypothetical protein [Bacillus haynesii]MEC1471828.1 hypothetical protein [Bacillus haynesii]MEC1486452.1 hypothetical protein [Bacillus haynesii]MEC1559585.1 hypothetical protein [Bacillus haynesii]